MGDDVRKKKFYWFRCNNNEYFNQFYFFHFSVHQKGYYVHFFIFLQCLKDEIFLSTVWILIIWVSAFWVENIAMKHSIILLKTKKCTLHCNTIHLTQFFLVNIEWMGGHTKRFSINEKQNCSNDVQNTFN